MLCKIKKVFVVLGRIKRYYRYIEAMKDVIILDI